VNGRFLLASNFTSGDYSMSLIEDLLERPFDQAITSKYTAMNGLIYLGVGTLVLIWPGMVRTIFRDAAFVGNEAALIRVMGMTVMVIGWLYLFGGLSAGRRIVAAKAYGERDAFSAMRGSGADRLHIDLRRQHVLCVLLRRQPRRFLSSTTACWDLPPRILQNA
jgi:hypothetical protein